MAWRDEQRNIINGVVSDKNYYDGFNVQRANLPDWAVSRVSDTVVRLWLKMPDHKTDMSEVMTVTIPASANSASSLLSVTPTFQVTTSFFGQALIVAHKKRRQGEQ